MFLKEGNAVAAVAVPKQMPRCWQHHCRSCSVHEAEGTAAARKSFSVSPSWPEGRNLSKASGLKLAQTATLRRWSRGTQPWLCPSKMVQATFAVSSSFPCRKGRETLRNSARPRRPSLARCKANFPGRMRFSWALCTSSLLTCPSPVTSVASKMASTNCRRPCLNAASNSWILSHPSPSLSPCCSLCNTSGASSWQDVSPVTETRPAWSACRHLQAEFTTAWISGMEDL
mmetsp:Transcript_72609/g.115247  ORF Transcript_72609/g.115247 Transcript_72609/m.115247 type:complete len:229 (+) Transcript_72609:1187-1873(+)